MTTSIAPDTPDLAGIPTLKETYITFMTLKIIFKYWNGMPEALEQIVRNSYFAFTTTFVP